MDPVTALRQIAYYKDRAREDPRRVMAYRNAADIVESLSDAQRERLGTTNSWQSLPGVGPKTAKVIAQAWAGREPDTLVELREAAVDLGGGEVRSALRGDLHVHSNWSDGSAPIEEMMLAARDLGHEYCALTDHSPRLKIANGLSPDRLREQLDVIEDLREAVAPMRILTGIEVDILEDGSLDQEPELLERLDVVVASVHSKLAMDSEAMTRRMVKAVRTVSTLGAEASSSMTKVWKVPRSLATQCRRKSDSPETIHAARTIGQLRVRSAKALSSLSDW